MMLRRLRFDNRGNSMPEFALAAGLFATILLGILEFGYAAWAKNGVAADAREGARYAIVHGGQRTPGISAATASTNVSNYVKSKTSLDQTIVVTATYTPNTDPGATVAVKVKHFVPRRGPFIAAHTDSSTSTMVVIY